MRRYLVTGAAGFIGRRLVQMLLTRGDAVVAVDPALAHGLSWPDGSSGHPLPVEEWARYEGPDGQVDAIIHLGSPVGTIGVTHYAGSVAARIVAATQAVIDIAGWGIPLINVSTSEVYGGGTDLGEHMPCVWQPAHSARKAYALGKLAAEADVHTAGLRRAISVRPFNVAGPGQSADLGFVLPRWARQHVRGEPVTVFGSGQAQRAFTHVDDFCDLLLLLADDPAAWRDPILNASNVRNTRSIMDLARLMQLEAERHLGACSPVEHVAGPGVTGWEDAPTKLPDTTLVASYGWQPTRPVEQVVREVLEHEALVHQL